MFSNCFPYKVGGSRLNEVLTSPSGVIGFFLGCGLTNFIWVARTQVIRDFFHSYIKHFQSLLTESKDVKRYRSIMHPQSRAVSNCAVML